MELVIARTEPFAADGVGATPLGFQGQAVRHLWEASRWGVGETDNRGMGWSNQPGKTRSLQLGQPKCGARDKEIGS
jgi:hypothetical protein